MNKLTWIDGKAYRAVPVMRGPGENPCVGCAGRAPDAAGMSLCLQLPDCGPHYGPGYIFEEVKDKP